MIHSTDQDGFETWVFPKILVPQNGSFIMENPIKMDDLGGPPLFLETSSDLQSKGTPAKFNSSLPKPNRKVSFVFQPPWLSGASCLTSGGGGGKNPVANVSFFSKFPLTSDQHIHPYSHHQLLESKE